MAVYFWNIFMTLMGIGPIILAIDMHFKQRKLLKSGTKAIAVMVRYARSATTNDRIALRLGVFKFKDSTSTTSQQYFVTTQSNCYCFLGEQTPIYFNPANPEKEYYMPKKDFLSKYICLIIGLFFGALGSLNMLKEVGTEIETYIAYLLVAFFSTVALVYSVGLFYYLYQKRIVHKYQNSL